MKTETLNKKIEKLTNARQLNKTSLVYNWVKNLKTNAVIRPVYSQGYSWRYSTLVDKMDELTTTLTSLKIKFIVGNDAPRGGKTGAFVQIKTKLI